METPKGQIVDSLKKANNILVTVSRNPSVDQLAAAIGLTLVLNKLGKHAIAVFSGQAPSTIEFLKPEETLEKTTDSLRDFIISLDKSKADKLRYKVEDQMVKIFITPYKTSLTEADLQFSQGDFNVDAVLALGVHEQVELDQAITSQGRILHDATLIAVSADLTSNLGSINWTEQTASSLCEMLTGLSNQLKEGVLDNQIATAYLTGIVAETNRFSNQKTSPATMQISSQLMSAGANQQLVADSLQQPEATPSAPDGKTAPAQKTVDGALEIAHAASEEQPEAQPEAQPQTPDEGEDDDPGKLAQINIDEHGQLTHDGGQAVAAPMPPVTDTVLPPSVAPNRGLALTPPTFGAELTANTKSEGLDPSMDIIGSGAIQPGIPAPRPMLNRDSPSAADAPPTNTLANESSTEAPVSEQLPSPQEEPEPESQPTLRNIEESVNSPHLQMPDPVAATPVTPDDPLQQPPSIDEARNAILQATQDMQAAAPAPAPGEPTSDPSPIDNMNEQQLDDFNVEPAPADDPSQVGVIDSNAPPPVPPPMMPPLDPSNPNPQ